MIEVHSYLLCDGNCAAAMATYHRLLGGTLEQLLVRDSPMAVHMPPGHQEKVLNATLRAPGFTIMASDWLAPQPFQAMQGSRLYIALDQLDDATRIFDALADGGHVTEAFKGTFWAEGFGSVEDKFGTRWMVGVARKA